MDEDVRHIPYDRARDMFEAAATSMQFNQVWAKTLGQSVWHLENRGLKGVQLGLLWLMLAKDMSYDARHGSRPQDGPPTIPCPVSAAMVLMRSFGETLQAGEFCTIQGPASPLLALPILQGFVHEHGFDVKLESHGETLTYGKNGIMVPDGFPMRLLWVDPSCAQVSRYSLVAQFADRPEAYDIPFRRRKTLPIPKARLNRNYAALVI